MGLFTEIIVDNFAGGGGASTGIEMATGRSVDIAINHDPDAIAMHKVNHPQTEHYEDSVWNIVPREAAAGRPVALAWLSPDCTHFSKARGGKPVAKNIRGLAWVALRWGATAKPRVMMLENVEEFQTWGPMIGDMPCPKRKGKTFDSFKRALTRQGYNIEHRELRACDYGSPTIRKRFFMVMRRDGQPIVWPKPTHGHPDSKEVKAGKLKPYRTAAECVDWSIPVPSIFDRKRPLALNTCKRIAKGMMRFVIENPNPFVVSYYGPKKDGEFRGISLDQPLPTQTTENRFALVNPFVATLAHGEGAGRTKRWGAGVRDINQPLPTITASGGYAICTPFITEHANASSQRNMPINQPLRTQCAQVKGGHFAIVSPFVAKHYTGVVGQSLNKPLSTITSIDHHSMVYAHLVKLRNNQYGQSVLEPVPTLTAGGGHVGIIHSWVQKYYGTNIGHACDEPLQTITGKHRFALTTIKSIKPPLSDDLLYMAWWCARFMDEYTEQPKRLTQIPEPRRGWVNVGDGVLYDIGMRMFQPRELYTAQGFPTDYIIDHDIDGKKITKTSQVARCGNSVPPQLAEALVRANMPELCQQSTEAAA